MGIDIVHEGSDHLEENLRGRADGTTDWDADLAVVPQPGLVADLAGEGALSPLSDVVGANVELGWDHTWSEAGTVDGNPQYLLLLVQSYPFLTSYLSFFS